MRVDVRSRRMFLQGAGGVLLAMPSLPSLLWKVDRVRASDTTPQTRYVQWVVNNGHYDEHFWPDNRYAPTEPVVIDGAPVAHLKARPLSDIPGEMSIILSAAFEPVRAKINVIRGLDMMSSLWYHNSCVPTCASWPRKDNHIPFFAHSVDSILEGSAKIYPTPVRTPVLRLTPGVRSASWWGSFCWTTENDKPLRLPAYETPEAAAQALFGNTQGDAALAAQARTTRLVDEVVEDYRHVANLSALGTSDRQLLSHYIDLLADVQRRSKGDAPACSTPTLQEQTDNDSLHQNSCDLAVAAMLCGTRVVAYHCYHGLSEGYDEKTIHVWSHDEIDKHAQTQRYRYAHFARLLHTMDQMPDVDGKSLLDNSVAYVGNELSDPTHAKSHLQNMGVIVAGGAAGKLSTGNYLDYTGRLFNNVFITIFHALGLAPEDYQRNGVIGFGDYEGKKPERYTTYLTNAERQKPLPYLFR
jgi:hypothetical protein